MSHPLPRHLDADSPTEDRSAGRFDSFDRLAEEFAERMRKGESPSIAEYESRSPADASRIREVLSAVVLMEQLRKGSAPPSRSMPKQIDEFRVIRELGRGGMGVVYEAVQESLGRHVALKAIHHVHLDARRLLRFQRETQAVAQLHHTNIVPIFGVGEHDGLPYYVMQYIKGDGLDVLLQQWRKGGWPRDLDRWKFSATLAMEAAEAIQYAHDQGILHRDIKPANLLVDEARNVWITDFGLAKLTGREELTASGDVIGTLRYLAPESLHGQTDSRSDVYSLGLTLYEVVTLNPPFGEMTPSELLHCVSGGKPAEPRKLEPSIPADLETIILKSIAREPSHRYQTAGDLAADLRSFLEDRPIRARRVTPIERLYRWGRRNRAIAAMTVAAAASLMIATIVGWVSYGKEKRSLERVQEEKSQVVEANKRADANLALSLRVFGDLFEKLTFDDPFSDPPLGLMARLGDGSIPEMGGPRPGFGPDRREGPPGDGLPGRDAPFRDENGPPPPPDREGRFGNDGPPPDRDGGDNPPRRGNAPGQGPPGMDMTRNVENREVLLQTLLKFYDEFASVNSRYPKDAKLQIEAARAYRKVAALNLSLRNEKAWKEATDHATGLLDVQLQRGNLDREELSKIADTYAMVDPWRPSPEFLPGVESQLLKAATLADRSFATDPNQFESAKLCVQVGAKLGAVRQRLGKLQEAEQAYSRAAELASDLEVKSKLSDELILDLVTVYEGRVKLRIQEGRTREALSDLDQIGRYLRRVPPGFMAHPVEDAARSLARSYETLGETRKAQGTSQRFHLSGGGPFSPRGPGRGPDRRDRKPGPERPN